MIVALEGLPGAGKTTTARLLAESRGCAYVHESSANHPFLESFYSDIERYKLETELCFVLLHYHQYRDLRIVELGMMILDYSPVKDLVFADLNLSGPDYDLFVTLYAHTSGSLPPPDVAVFLDLDIAHALARIRERGRDYERDMDPTYLQRLREAYERRHQELGVRVERVKVEPEWTRAEVMAAVGSAIGSPR
jgi:deoxyguanosine kinase